MIVGSSWLCVEWLFVLFVWLLFVACCLFAFLVCLFVVRCALFGFSLLCVWLNVFLLVVVLLLVD